MRHNLCLIIVNSFSFYFSKNDVYNLMQQLIGERFYKNISSAVNIKCSEMLAHNTTCCLCPVIEFNMQWEIIMTVCDWTYHCKSCNIIEIIITHNDCWSVACLFMIALWIKINLDYISLFYHSSCPTLSPQSTSEHL